MAHIDLYKSQHQQALMTMRFCLDDIKNFKDMVNGLGRPDPNYTTDDVKMYIRGLEDKLRGFFDRNNIPIEEATP